MDVLESPRSPEEEEDSNPETWCLRRVGTDSEWLRLFDNTEVTIGRGLNVTHQLVSAAFPLMISRLHCSFKQTQDGEWTVTDKKSLNGVFVNGERIPVEKAHQLVEGDFIQVGLPVVADAKVEFEYMLIRRPIRDIIPHLTEGSSEGAGAAADAASRGKKAKRKLSSDELEPSTSSKPKLCRHSSSADRPPAPPGPHQGPPERPEARLGDEAGPRTTRDEAGPSVGRRERPSGPTGPDQTDLQREDLKEQVKERRAQLEALEAQMNQIEALDRSVSEAGRQLAMQKTQQQAELMKKQLEEALTEQRKVMAELALSRQGFQEVLLAKDKELEETKEEKEKARAQKEEVVNQMTEVLESELQCIICSELFIQAVTLSCAHSFCQHCIGEWRKRKEECPICRQAIRSETRSLVLDNCIDRMVDNLSPDMRQRRQALISQRKAQPEAVQSRVQPQTHYLNSSSSSDSSGDSELDDNSDSISSMDSINSSTNLSVLSLDPEDPRWETDDYLVVSDEDDDDDDEDDHILLD